MPGHGAKDLHTSFSHLRRQHFSGVLQDGSGWKVG